MPLLCPAMWVSGPSVLSVVDLDVPTLHSGGIVLVLVKCVYWRVLPSVMTPHKLHPWSGELLNKVDT